MKTITFTIIFLCCITLTSAIYAGESYEIELEKPFTYYSIVGNSTEVNISVTQDGNTVTIIPDEYSQEDSYEIVFFDKEEETITVYRSSGGGGTRTVYKNRDVIEYVGVDNYLDREVEVEVPGEDIIVEKEVIKTNFPFWTVMLLITISIVLCWVLYKQYFKVDTNERRYE